jgi:hypothetical protein
MTKSEFAIVCAALRIGLGFESVPFRHQIERLEHLLKEVGDRHQAARLREMLNPSRPPDFTPVVRSG